MGNSQPKYFSQPEALAIIDHESYDRIYDQLFRICGKFLDYQIFHKIIISRFNKMPTALCECLFQAFAADDSNKVEINDFICALAVIKSNDRAKMLRFLFRVYSSESPRILQRNRSERILFAAYENLLNQSAAKRQLDEIFSDDVRSRHLNLKELESYEGPTNILEGWVKTVLSVFLEPLPAGLVGFERRYSLSQETERLMAQYGLSSTSFAQLKQLFFSYCAMSAATGATALPVASQGSSKGELSLSAWQKWIQPYAAPALARVIFRAKLGLARSVWRFMDFAEFCMVFGMAPVESRAATLCSSFQRTGKVTTAVDKAQMRRMLRLLCEAPPSTSEAPSREAESAPKDIHRRSTHLSETAEPTVVLESLPDADTEADQVNFADVADVTDADLLSIPAPLQRDLLKLEGAHGSDPPLQAYVSLLCQHHDALPAMRELHLAACIRFGVRPATPKAEQRLVMELFMRRTVICPHPHRPFGPPGCEWCVVPMSWWQAWQLYVGQDKGQRQFTLYNASANRASSSIRGIGSHGSDSSPTGASPEGKETLTVSDLLNCAPSGSSSPPPPPIDNWTILKKNDSKPLLPNLEVGKHIEVLPPVVYDALVSWYGGGPKVSRCVIAVSGGEGVEMRRAHQEGGLGRRGTATELELYPVCVRVTTCDNEGKAKAISREHLFSRAATGAQVSRELCRSRSPSLDPTRTRLWNCARESWRDQYVLSPELTVDQAKIIEGQLLLLEISLPDGSWPKSRLHAQLELETNPGSGHGSNQLTHSRGALVNGHGQVSVSGAALVQAVRNQGLVGLENLGNTCYMNASLQALLHTEPLVGYFLEKRHLRDVNIHSKFGFGGRLAYVFGKLITELWTSDRPYIAPRAFKNALSHLKPQFRGHEQHDAQELLAFLLDGLSEDLNLVHDKPYTEQPDSDGRPDADLADIWWTNHFKRERSVIQAIFSGQFKSVMTCVTCGFSSARFEPFNILALPLPEDTPAYRLVYLLPRHSVTPILVSIRVVRGSLVSDVVKEVQALSAPPPTDRTDMMQAVSVSPEWAPDSLWVPALNFQFVNGGAGSGAAMATGSSTSTQSPPALVLLPLDYRVESIPEHDALFLFEVTTDLQADRLMLQYCTYMFAVMNVGPTEIPEDVVLVDTLPRGLQSTDTSDKLRNASDTAAPSISSSSQTALADGSTTMEDISDIASTTKDSTPKASLGQSLHTNASTVLRFHSNDSTTDNDDESGARAKPGLGHLTTKAEPEEPSSIPVRVVLVQRRARLEVSGASRGLECFIMEPFGSPVVEVVDKLHLTGKRLYQLVSWRLAQLMKAKVSELGLQVERPPSSDGSSRANSPISPEQPSGAKAPSARREAWRSTAPSVTIEEAVASDVPVHGFMLRFVSPSGVGCTRCPWLRRCEGCAIPNDRQQISVSDGETVAIDWHYVVYQELVDVNAATGVKRHQSSELFFKAKTPTIPLSRCLGAMFGEDERLEGGMCPKCKNDKELRNKLSLWRLPPVLVLQLKRFQFDRRVRRKLTSQVDLPLDGLDLWSHLAPSRQQQLMQIDDNLARTRQMNGEGAEASSSTTTLTSALAEEGEVRGTVVVSEGGRQSAVYDLYAVVHHLGVMGGGHYVTTIRDRDDSSLKSSGSSAGEAQPAADGGGKWRVFNDDQITSLDSREVSGPSAYLLFYRRRPADGATSPASWPDIDLDVDNYAIGEPGSPSDTAPATATNRDRRADYKNEESRPGSQAEARRQAPITPATSSSQVTAVRESGSRRGFTEAEFDAVMMQNKPPAEGSSLTAVASSALLGATTTMGLKKDACLVM